MEKTSTVKGLFVTTFAFLSAKLGILFPVISILLVVMLTDYITGIVAAGYRKELKSRTGIWGIIKKMFYGVLVAIGMIVDWIIINVGEHIGIIIPVSTFFGLVTALWLIFNELISIIENILKLEVISPPFLVRFVSKFKNIIENQGEKLSDNIKGDDDNANRKEANQL